MNDSDQDLKRELNDPDYRYGYAESFLNTKIATQIKTLREQRGKTQAEMAALMGITQPGYRRFEDVNHSVWKTDSLWSVARANGVRVNISFEAFGSLMEDKKNFTKKSLERPSFENDPAFKEPSEAEQDKVNAVVEPLRWNITIPAVQEDPRGLIGELWYEYDIGSGFAAASAGGGITATPPASGSVNPPDAYLGIQIGFQRTGGLGMTSQQEPSRGIHVVADIGMREAKGPGIETSSSGFFRADDDQKYKRLGRNVSMRKGVYGGRAKANSR